MIIDYYLIFGIGPQRINTEGIAFMTFITN